MANARLVPSGRKSVTANRSSTVLARELIETVVLTLVVFLVVNFAVSPFSVDGPSMQPGLVTGDRVMVNKLAYDFGGPARGDVIVFHPPSAPSAVYVKRVIGIPGDRVTITASEVIVNGVTLREPYIEPLDSSAPENSNVLPTLTLGPGQYFVMGDNRQNSIDSRIFGFVPRNNIIGKAQFIYWPLPAVRGVPTYAGDFGAVGR